MYRLILISILFVFQCASTSETTKKRARKNLLSSVQTEDVSGIQRSIEEGALEKDTVFEKNPDEFHTTALLTAINYNKMISLKTLLDIGANPNSFNTGEHPSLLMITISLCKTEAVDILINKGADIDYIQKFPNNLSVSTYETVALCKDPAKRKEIDKILKLTRKK
ncbi:MAG: hypothetical protein O9301_08510 [Leptospira sp.]|nr:hypothetical protein [Leptospira sp.]